MHEPSDVTIELDGTGRQLSELSPGDGPEKGSGPTQGADNEITDGPVFVDASGRRSKKFRRAGWVVAIACAVFAVTLVVSLMGGSSTTAWLNIPGAPGGKKNEKVKNDEPGPSDSPKAKHSKGGLLPLPLVTNSNGVVVTPSLSVNPTTGVTSTSTPTKGSTKPPKAPTSTKSTGVPAGGGTPTTGNTPTTPPADTPTTPPVDPPTDPPVDPPTDPPVDPPTDPTTPPTDPPAGNEGSQNLAVEGAQ
jgi:hypothetical protein